MQCLTDLKIHHQLYASQHTTCTELQPSCIIIKHIHIFKKDHFFYKYKLNICEIQIKHANAIFSNMKFLKK